MPNRILRDWTDSETIDLLTIRAEIFFTRLIMKVDDYGRYSANIKMLKSTLFPLKTDIRETDITRWLTECEKSGLIVLYLVASKEYVQIKNFKQVLRQKLQKFPAPADDNIKCLAYDKHMTSICFPETKRNEVETKGNELAAQKHEQLDIDLFKNFQNWLSKNAPRVNQLKEPLTIDQYLNIRQKIPKDVLTKVLKAMQNRASLLKDYVSANLTIQNWCEREDKINPGEQNINVNQRLKAAFNGSDKH